MVVLPRDAEHPHGEASVVDDRDSDFERSALSEPGVVLAEGAVPVPAGDRRVHRAAPEGKRLIAVDPDECGDAESDDSQYGDHDDLCGHGPHPLGKLISRSRSTSVTLGSGGVVDTA